MRLRPHPIMADEIGASRDIRPVEEEVTVRTPMMPFLAPAAGLRGGTCLVGDSAGPKTFPGYYPCSSQFDDEAGDTPGR